jgi:hypothetical protein
VVWLRFFVVFGARRGSDRTHSHKSTGKTQGLQRYPGKVMLQALVPQGTILNGVYKSTKKTRLGQPVWTL